MTPRFIEVDNFVFENDGRYLQATANVTNVTVCAEQLKLQYLATGNTTTALGAYVSCVVTTVASDVAAANATTTPPAGVGSVQIAASFAAILLTAFSLL